MVQPFALLPRSMQRFNRDVQRGLSRLAQNTAIAIAGTATDTTRADSGVARSNWRASVNTPLSGVIPAYAPGVKIGMGETGNANAAKSQQRQAVKTFDAGKDRSIFIVNRTPYIETLNNGRPGVAPDNMVERGLQSGRNVVRSTKTVSGRR